MPDESDDHDDGAADGPVDGSGDETSDATADSTTNAEDSTESADDSPDADVSEADDSTEDAPDGEESSDSEAVGADDDSSSDDDSGGLEKVEDDDDSGGLEKVDSRVEPRTRRVDVPEEGEEMAVPDDGVVADEEKVPNRGVEAGFERPDDAPEKHRPEHPDKLDANGGSDVPVGHAAGAPKPGEASPAGAGASAGTGTGTGTGSGGGRTIEDDEDLFEGPPDDEEMPLADHIEEMMLRLAAVVFAGAVATILMYLYSDFLVMEMWTDILPAGQDAARPHLYAPLEFIFTKIKVASLAGVLIALPVLVYQSYLFMRPGLYPQERRYYLAAVPTSLVLAVAGMAFAYFAVLPGLFQYFDYYTEGNAIIAYGLQSTFNLIVALMGLQAVVFQIPLFVMLAIMMGVTSRRWLESRRLLFWGAFGGIAFLFAPDPTGMAPFIIAVSMIVLFEGTLALLRWTGR
ncbi:twin-arginine translocase subunit TatC [Halorubellus sp. PRR65]|uniref:twin-arginine translocase subunit TatC n=1 Tax=Halorubellus sp. PRR65 TaxID=3098148 RepID=UPI002B262CA2|nr:twin-arginine translocase subunit TatC [Halorubellus sp. PRR65]